MLPVLQQCDPHCYLIVFVRQGPALYTNAATEVAWSSVDEDATRPRNVVNLAVNLTAALALGRDE